MVLDFLVYAYEQIVEARRVLRWTYAYVYYLDGWTRSATG
jgi:ariadne-1